MSTTPDSKASWVDHPVVTWAGVVLLGGGAALGVAELVGVTDSAAFLVVSVVAVVGGGLMGLTDKLKHLHWSQAWPRLGVGLLVAAAVFLVVALADEDRSALIRPMTGAFNVAVAGFEETGGGDGVEPGLSTGLSQELKRRLRRLEVAGPRNVPSLSGETDAARAANAARAADRIDADLLLYGQIEYGAGATRLTPEFYVSPRKLVGAEELAGSHDLGGAIVVRGDIGRNTEALDEVRSRLVSATEVVIRLARGLARYEQTDYAEARKVFEEAVRFDLGRGAEVVHLFVGNAALLQGDDEAAEAAYRQALNIDRTYARAYLGLGELAYHRSSGSNERRCEKGADAAGLRSAIRWFESAEEQPDPPALTVPKARFGAGRVHLCLALAGETGHWPLAFQALGDVVAEYEQARRETRPEARTVGFVELAALAHGALGDTRYAMRQYELAADEYRRAISMMRNLERPDWSRRWNVALGCALLRVGRATAAEDAFAAAVAIQPRRRRDVEREAELCGRT